MAMDTATSSSTKSEASAKRMANINLPMVPRLEKYLAYLYVLKFTIYDNEMKKLVDTYFTVEERKNTVSIYGQEVDLESYDHSEKPIWKVAEEIASRVPDEEWAKVPSDLSKNYKYYLYNDSKKP